MKSPLLVALKFGSLLAAGLLLAASAQPGSTLKDADFAGVYTLVSVNGKPVPADVTHGGAALQVRSGTFTLGADGTCSTRTVFAPPAGTEVVREVSGTYSKEGSQLTMQWKGAGKTVGTIDGHTFSMDNEGLVFVYRK